MIPSRTSGWSVPRGGLLVLATIGLGSAACVDDTVSMFIEQNQTPVASGTGAGAACTVTNSEMALHTGEGVMDISLRNDYLLFPLYHSEVLSSASATAGRPEARGIMVLGANVTLENEDGTLPRIPDGAGGMVNPQYTVTTNTYVPPAGASGPGFADGEIEIIPGTVGNALAGAFCQPTASSSTANCPIPAWPSFYRRFVVSVKPFGVTTGGVQVSGSEYRYPVNVCCHCLIDFDPSADNPDIPGADCSATLTSTTFACNLGQDFVAPCSQCAGSDPLACQPRGFIGSGAPTGTTCP